MSETLTVTIEDEDGQKYDVEVSGRDPDPASHALVMLRGALIKDGPLPRGLRIVEVRR